LTAASLLEELDRRNVRLSVDGDRLRYKAPRGSLTPKLKEEVRLLKPEVIQALHADVIARQRWGLAPTLDIPLASGPPLLDKEQRALLVAKIQRQSSQEVLAWILSDGGQADKYETARKWPSGDCDMAAVVDVLLWQNQRTLKSEARAEALQELMSLLA